ncbi:MAG TPA: ubiquinone/menaquinone biosynthesis methyltransferase [Candidatus Acidoferrum sp.]|nr:ubiquinone/menaquinone biosynthesis methyltransferase [Candidatus Acidoferrum sp.]
MIATQNQPSLPGTRPEGVRDEREAAARVRDMFTRIAPRYDFLNHLLSFSLDHLWRRRTAKRFLHILRRPDARVLDLCCGTGDLAFALDRARAEALRQGTASAVPKGGEKLKALAPEVEARGFSPAKSEPLPSGVLTPGGAPSRFPIIGSDFVEPMLVRARDKARAGHRAVVFAAADALRLPFPDASFDLITAAFGFRNLANYEEGLREFARVLKRGGELGILEFTEPTSGPMAGLFRFYFKNILPRIGGAISGNAEAYKYLPGSVSKFPSPPELSALMEKCGFRDVRMASWNFGSVILHSASRS